MNNSWGNIFKNVKPGKKTGGFMLVVASGAAIGAPVTLQHEGMRLKPYYDSIGIKTWCAGETEIGYKESFTKDECSQLFLVRYGYYSERTAMFYNETAQKILAPEIHAAMVDMSYNVGLGAFGKSSMIKELNDGNPIKACNAILKYRYAGGFDCSQPGNRICPGIWDRRLKMIRLCLEGVL